MCEFLSGWINVKTMDPVLADLRSHSETEQILGWKREEVEQHREWEWTRADNGQSLSVRTSSDDAGDWGGMLRASLLARWKHRDDAVREAVFMVNDAGGSLDLHGCRLPADIKLPASIGGSLYLRGCRLPEGLKLPESIGERIYTNGARLYDGRCAKIVDDHIRAA